MKWNKYKRPKKKKKGKRNLPPWVAPPQWKNYFENEAKALRNIVKLP